MAIISNHQIYIKLRDKASFDLNMSYLSGTSKGYISDVLAEFVDTSDFYCSFNRDKLTINIEYNDINEVNQLAVEQYTSSLSGAFIAWYSQNEVGISEFRYGTLPNLYVAHGEEAEESASHYFDFQSINGRNDEDDLEEVIYVLKVHGHIFSENIEGVVELFSEKNDLLNDISVKEFFDHINEDCSDLIKRTIAESPAWAYTDEGLGIGEHLVPIRYTINGKNVVSEYRVSSKEHAQSMMDFLTALYMKIGIELVGTWSLGQMTISEYHNNFRHSNVLKPVS